MGTEFFIGYTLSEGGKYEIQVVGEAEKNRIVKEFNEQGFFFPADQGPQSLEAVIPVTITVARIEEWYATRGITYTERLFDSKVACFLRKANNGD